MNGIIKFVLNVFMRTKCLACWLVSLWVPLAISAPLHHTLEATLSPDQYTIVVQDTISGFDTTSGALEFTLHPALQLEILTPEARLTRLPGGDSDALPALNLDASHADWNPRRYRVELPPDQQQLTLRYHGQIRHALAQQGEEYARGFRETRGTISTHGVFLSGHSYWYPHVDGEPLTFDLRLHLPQGWHGMTQGDRVERKPGTGNEQENWRCDTPQEEIYLIAGAFTEYRQTTDGVLAMVLLREPDPALAQKYLDTTHDYIKLYSDLIGPYPYGKFAMVENFWETGYGMPSFTLLGRKVIRFPFILHSSYPHEILHNWWGNSVYIDYTGGNWAEGLTSYLADHLIKEQRGQGTGYRRTTLQKYTDYVRQQQDFPLTDFRARHSPTTEAVGYGKTLMLFHMLRQQLGDEAFVQGLRDLYSRYQFQVADYDAVQAVFTQAAEQPLDTFFEQWVERPGAPMLSVSQVSAKAQDDGHILSAIIEQTQPDAPYALQVPVAVHLDGREQAWQTRVSLDGKRTPVEIHLPAAPLRLDIDPEFDVFRRLHREEIPPAISQVFGAERILIVLPAQAPAPLLDAYESLAQSWQQGRPEQIGITLDRDIEKLPRDRAIWLFGGRNRFRAQLTQAVAAYAFEDQGETIRIAGTELPSKTHSLVVLGRHPENPDQALGWLATNDAAALPGLGRKLPHYGRYSYLAFTGKEPANVLKGQWPVLNSPLSVPVSANHAAASDATRASLAPRTALVAPTEKFSTRRMQRDISALAGPAMAGRGLGSLELDQAADYIAEQFRAAGLQPGGDEDGFFQTWQEQVATLGGTSTMKNVIGLLPGTDPDRAGESLVVGAHYDHFGRGEYPDHAEDRGKVHPGADDNASGITVMLELARKLGGKPRPRTILFVAFTGEETGRLGSRHYVQHVTRYPADKIIAMVNLDTVGRLGENPLTAFGTGTADEWVHILRGAGYVTGVPVKPVADDIGSSDQTSFIETGVPAVQLFGGVHEDIHRPGDTPDKIDLSGLVKTAEVLQEITGYLAERPEPLHSTLAGAQSPAQSPNGGTKRHVSLGTVPDYAYAGDGVLIDDIRAGTPAEQAGLRKGDVIIAVNEISVTTLRDYAQALKTLQPGDEIRICFQRDGRERNVTTQVIVR